MGWLQNRVTSRVESPTQFSRVVKLSFLFEILRGNKNGYAKTAHSYVMMIVLNELFIEVQVTRRRECDVSYFETWSLKANT
jgi:hypothetical protein